MTGPAVNFGFGPIPPIAVRLGPPTPKGDPMPDVPAGLGYSADHLWVRHTTTGLLVGVTDFAQQSLGDIVAVTPPAVGDAVVAGEPCGEIESVKSLSDLVAPISGTVRRVNDDLGEAPELVNTSPYYRGWLFEVDPVPVNGLLDPAAYRELIGA